MKVIKFSGVARIYILFVYCFIRNACRIILATPLNLMTLMLLLI